jgi:hypothetical protein
MVKELIEVALWGSKTVYGIVTKVESTTTIAKLQAGYMMTLISWYKKEPELYYPSTFTLNLYVGV